MTSLVRGLAHRVLPVRVRVAARTLISGPPPTRPVTSPPPPKKKAAKKPAKKATGKTARAARRPAPAPAPWTGSPAVETLRTGGSLAAALVAEIRGLLAAGQRGPALAVAASLQADPQAVDLGHLIGGLLAAEDGYHELAWQHLSELPEPMWTAHVPSAYARSGLIVDPDEALRRIADLAERRPAEVEAQTWFELIGPVFGHGDHDLVGRLFAVLDARVGDGTGVSESLVINRDWLRPWVAASADAASAAPVPEGSVSFAIMDYGHPGRNRASANIGDHVQSLASLGHLARHSGFRYDGPQDLVDLLTRLSGRVRPELQLDEATATVQLLQIDRDASAYAAIPPQTWTLAFGWYMHAIFETRYGFPFHPNLLPIFVSFHCSKRELLTEEAIDYLRRYAPIGCRDWTTVDILLSVGVPAFFSGCLTTTVRTVFPERPAGAVADGPVAYVDMPAKAVPSGAPKYAHSSDAIRFRSFATNVGDAIDLLETYRRDHSGLVSTRLHCYLPVRSLGVPVDFQPNNRSDPRFAGLIDITDAEFVAIQDRIDGRLAAVFTAIARGEDAEQVYGLWRELSADDVALAEARRAADHPLPAPRSGLIADVTALRPAVAGLDPHRPVVAVTVAPDQAEAARVLIASLGDQAQVVVLDRSGGALIELGGEVTVVPTGGLGRDLRAAGRTLADADIDRLILPELLIEHDRIIVLPAEALVEGDLTELVGLELDDRLLAAADPAGKHRASGFAVLNVAANRLRNATTAAAELRRRGYARHAFDFDAFETDVLVLDAARWRSEGLTALSLSLIEEFGLTYREVLHFLAGPHRLELPERWHLVPGRSVIVDPALIHWAGPAKPWGTDLAVEHDRWVAAREVSVGHR